MAAADGRKLGIKVVYASSEDAGYPASELNLHGPATLGWQSLKFCDYPQEIGLTLLKTSQDEEPSIFRLSQFQLLSHQFKIASRIEIFVGNDTGANRGDEISGYSSAVFKRLGFMTLDTNERSNLTARELKTVYIKNEPAQYLKLIFHCPHPNSQNLFKQVGLVAINVIGTSNSDTSAAPIETNPRADSKEPNLCDGNELMRNATKSIHNYVNSVTNDLSYTYSMDAQTATRLKYLAECKEAAIIVEDFVKAERIKNLEKELKKLGSRLVELDVAKADAVKAEEFSLAKSYKDEAEAFRQRIDKKITDLLSGVPTVADAKNDDAESKMQVLPAEEKSDGKVESAADLLSIQGEDVPDDGSSIVSPLASPSPRPFDDDDDEQLQEFSAPEPDHPLHGVKNYQDLPDAEELTDESLDIAEQSGILRIFEDYRTRCLFSKIWTLREAVMTKFGLMLTESEGFEEHISELATIIRIGVEDKFQQVLVKAVDLLGDVLRMLEGKSVHRNIILPFLEPIVTILVDKLSDGNHRFREAGRRGIDKIADSKNIGPGVIVQHVLKPLADKKRNAWRPLVSRLKLLTDFVTTYGFGSPGFTPEAVLSFIKNNSCFSHSHGEVRDAARDLTVSVQMLVGSAVVESCVKTLRPKQHEEFKASLATAQENARQQSRVVNKGAHHSPQSKQQKGDNPKVNTSAIRSESKTSYNEENEGKQGSHGCMFCGVGDDTWTEDQLDLHYWQSCPILSPCPACAQVVEVAGLPDHLLGECEYRLSFTQCEVTGLAIRTNEFAAFQQSATCKPPPLNFFYCPLCYGVAEDTDQAWRRHLLYYCKANPRGDYNEGMPSSPPQKS